MLAQNRSYFGAGGLGYYGVEVENLAPDGTEFDLMLTFKSGVRYCCIERGCHIPLQNRWFSTHSKRISAAVFGWRTSLSLSILQFLSLMKAPGTGRLLLSGRSGHGSGGLR